MNTRRMLNSVVLIALLSIVPAVVADAGLAILDFELNDLTLDPATVEELERTASIKPQLADRLVETYGYKVVDIGSEVQQSANKGFGYLFDHPDVAARLARTAGADWIVVGRVHKASFLFVYLKARLINVDRSRLVGDFVVEIKGPQKALTHRGIVRLAGYLDQAIRRELKHGKASTHE